MNAGTIVSLRAENVKKLKAVELKPDASGVFVVGGFNGAGKTTILDAIEWAMGGTSGISSMPVRKGEDHARIVIELDDLIVTRKFNEMGKSTLVVEAKSDDPNARARFSSGQSVLDKLVGNLSFDPLSFTRMKSDAQAKTLRDLVGIDTKELDERRADQYAYRTDINRQLKELDGQLKGMPFYENAPQAETSATALMTELKEIQAFNQSVNDAIAKADRAREAAAMTAGYVEQTAKTVADLEHQLTEAKKRHAEAVERLANDNKAFAVLESVALQMKPKSTIEIEAAIQNADDVNHQVRANAQRKDALAKLQALEAKSQACTEKIEAIDKQRQELVTNAAYPIEGLTFSEDGQVLFGGIPFDQCSQAEQLRVSIAIGMALNPKLRVLLIRDGSLMDDRTLAMVAKMAEEKGFQLWIEKVGEDESCSVIIEDGAVKATRKRKTIIEEALEAAAEAPAVTA
jgi:DNA repair exonuclease SbcCD ATPase subunit